MYRKLLFSTVLPLAFIACNQNDELKLQEGTVEQVAQEVDYFSDSSSALLPTNAPAISNTEITAQPVASPISTPPVQNNSNVKLNPEHGLPGHRCDIPVGAPLNTPAPSNTQNIQTNNPAPVKLSPTSVPAVTTPAPTSAPAQNVLTPVQTPTQAPSLSQTGQVKLNPEHGQPGHRCEIPVGSPLPE